VSPVLTALLAAVWLREQLQLRVLLGMLLALSGVVMIAQPETLFGGRLHTDLPWQFVAVAVAGAFFAALAYVTVRLLGRTEPALRVVFYFPIVTVPLSAPFALTQWVWPDAAGWAQLLGVGVTTQIAQIALTRGLAREPAGRAMAVGYLQIAFATLFGAVVFAALPGVWSWLGIALIVASLFVATRRRDPRRRRDRSRMRGDAPGRRPIDECEPLPACAAGVRAGCRTASGRTRRVLAARDRRRRRAAFCRRAPAARGERSRRLPDTAGCGDARRSGRSGAARATGR
jgi:uncharacterized membrane protein